MNILVVDDNKSVREYASDLLTQSGYTVSTAVNGLDGFEKAQKTEFHLYIVDHLMPLMNGVTLTRNLKQAPFCAQTPILFMTTQSEKSVGSLPEFDFFNDIITKPLNEDKFISIVKRIINELPSKIAV
jgi:two-component system chemotaxis response regulator CheY